MLWEESDSDMNMFKKLYWEDLLSRSWDKFFSFIWLYLRFCAVMDFELTLRPNYSNLLVWDWKWEGAIASKKFKTSWKNLCHWIRLEKFKNKVYSKKLFEKYDPMAKIFSNCCRPLDAISLLNPYLHGIQIQKLELMFIYWIQAILPSHGWRGIY